MQEMGFWDYTAPGGGGGLESYREEDWDRLLDDMAAGGFNSLVLGIKWFTTGYRSRLPWLDQDAAGAAEEEVAAITGNDFSFESPFQDYSIGGLAGSGEAVAVVIGTLLVLGVAVGLSRIVARKE